jgi:hypothetical protein
LIEENDFVAIKGENAILFKTLLEVVPETGTTFTRCVLVLFESGVNLARAVGPFSQLSHAAGELETVRRRVPATAVQVVEVAGLGLSSNDPHPKTGLRRAKK